VGVGAGEGGDGSFAALGMTGLSSPRIQKQSQRHTGMHQPVPLAGALNLLGGTAVMLARIAMDARKTTARVAVGREP
jgi:hypothetical protein